MLQPKPVFLKDYQPPAFRVENIDLEFDIRSISNVRITANTQFKRHDHGAKLILDGNPELVHIQSIALDGVELKEDQYQLTSEHKLEIPAVPEEFTLRIISQTDPTKNTSCIGLYSSEGILCTQCESEGFRNFTYALDRPDVFSTYRVTIEAEQIRFPHLLSNGKKRIPESCLMAGTGLSGKTSAPNPPTSLPWQQGPSMWSGTVSPIPAVKPLPWSTM
jgi:aminopeptidase N